LDIKGFLRQFRSLQYFLLFQLDDDTTVILSGVNNSKQILLFNWTTMKYTLHPSQLNADRSRGVCSLVKGNKEQIKNE
jgi:hypothetical protein